MCVRWWWWWWSTPFHNSFFLLKIHAKFIGSGQRCDVSFYFLHFCGRFLMNIWWKLMGFMKTKQKWVCSSDFFLPIEWNTVALYLHRFFLRCATHFSLELIHHAIWTYASTKWINGERERENSVSESTELERRTVRHAMQSVLCFCWIRFDMFAYQLSLCARVNMCAFMQLNHIICMKLIGAWLRSFGFCAQTHTTHTSKNEIDSITYRAVVIAVKPEQKAMNSFSIWCVAIVASLWFFTIHVIIIIWSLVGFVLPIWFFLHV